MNGARKEVPIITLKFLFVSLAFLASTFVFAFISHEAVREKEEVFDQRVATFLNDHLNPTTIPVMRFITFFGSTKFLLPAYSTMVIFLLAKRKRRDAINVLILAISSTGLLFGLKNFYHRSRPELPLFDSLRSFSFPSGHALCSFIFCSILSYFTYKSSIRNFYKWLIAAFLLIFSLLIGLSRIVLRMHYATDVIAGFSLGLAWVILSVWIFNKTEKRSML